MADTPQKPVRKARMRLSERDAIALANETLCSLSTIRRWAAGDEVLETTDIRIRKAVAKLGIESKAKGT